MDIKQHLKSAIRDVTDFPVQGIIFKDITTILNNPSLFQETIQLFYESVQNLSIDYVSAIEARGFIFGGALALRLGCGFVPIRKPGKLPYKTYCEEYALEYGTDALEIHQDAFPGGKSVLLVDDLLATGGTALAAAGLIKKCGGKVVGMRFLIELEFLNGISKLKDYAVESFLKF
jgi:adenine phosphoribosyltransferase